MGRAAPRIPREGIVWNRKRREGIRSRHLDFIRQLPCISCGKPGPNEAMHIRMSRADLGKYNTMSRKPDDKYTVPGCHDCHCGDQHTEEGERLFWARLGIDPLDLALRLWAVSGDLEAGMRAVYRARRMIELKRREAAARRQ